MKSLFATAGAFALLFSAAACEQRDPVMSDVPAATTPEPIETAEGSGPAREMYVLASGELEASDLMGASVQNTAGGEISIVEDIWLSNPGAAAMLVLRDGGVAGVGGDLRTVAFDAAAIVPDADKPGDEPNVIVRLTESTLDSLPVFKQASVDDYRLASEMIGKTVMTSPGGESVRINDLILSATGETTYAVVSPDLIAMDQIIVPAGAIIVAEGDTDGEVVLDLSAEAMLAAKGYARE